MLGLRLFACGSISTPGRDSGASAPGDLTLGSVGHTDRALIIDDWLCNRQNSCESPGDHAETPRQKRRGWDMSVIATLSGWTPHSYFSQELASTPGTPPAFAGGQS